MQEQLKYPEVRRRITAVRTALVLDEPFYGTLALRLKLVEEENCDCTDDKQCPHTAYTNGQVIGYYPRFVQSLKGNELKALICHEVMHCAMGHPWRRSGRDPYKWNVACDRAINPEMREQGYKLPDGALFELEPSHKGKSAEWIYDRLPRQTDQQQQGQQQRAQQGQGAQRSPRAGQGKEASGPGRPQDGQGQQMQGVTKPGSRSSVLGQGRENGEGVKNHKDDVLPNPQKHFCDPLGEVRDAPSHTESGEAPQSEADWKQAVQQAAVLAQGQGKLPASLKRFAKAAGKSEIDWKSALRRFVQEVARADYSFERPNVRYVAHGFYLPQLRSHEVGVIAVGVDTSGSIDQVLLDQFAAEIRTIASEVKPRQVRVLYVDAKLQHEDTFGRDDEIVMRPKGGGGTDFRPFFEAIASWDEPPVAAVYLTDLMGTFPDDEPATPTLWVTGNAKPLPVPFGEVVTAA